MRIIFIMFAIWLVGCTGKSEYAKIKEAELSKGIRKDSLFLELELGMTSRDFYDRCWKLNKQGLLTNGPSNLSAEYTIQGETDPEDIFMRFYPGFKDNKIWEMDVEFIYKGWAPWNQAFSSDSLAYVVKDYFEDWYDSEFKEAENSDKTRKLWYNVQGNRQIYFWIKDLKTVRVKMTDLTVEPPEEVELK